MKRMPHALLPLLLSLLGSLQAKEGATQRGEIHDRHGNVLATTDSDGNRVYPFGAAAGHTLGYTGKTRADIDGIVTPREGRDGVEKQLETSLGKGEHVKLTLDIRLQMATEHALRRIGAGAAIVTDPDTGEILAMATVPSFDPNDFTPSISQETFKKYQSNPARPLFNRARAQYPPGSIFKVVTALTVPAGDAPKHTCTGKMEIGDRAFHCWSRRGHGELDLKGALKYSCNPYFFQLGQQVRQEEILRVARLVGFGAKVGLPIQGEPACDLPERAAIKKRFGEEWDAGHTANLAIGQGYLLATPQQVAGAIGSIANNGTYIQPHLLLGQEPKTLDLTRNKVAHETLATVRSALFDVVNSEDGTGRRAQLKGKKVYGKTGTAQWKPKQYLAWFSGWVGDRGDKNRRYAITVVVENGQSAGRVAAPLARMILADCLTLSKKVPGKKLAPTRLGAYEGHVGTIEILDEK